MSDCQRPFSTMCKAQRLMGTCHDVGRRDGALSVWRSLLATAVPVSAQRKGRAARWAAVWGLLAGQEEELVEVVKDISKECFSERIMEQTAEIAVPRERV